MNGLRTAQLLISCPHGSFSPHETTCPGGVPPPSDLLVEELRRRGVIQAAQGTEGWFLTGFLAQDFTPYSPEED